MAGSASGWWFAKANTVDVYVVDVKKIVEAKKKELIENYKKSPTDETIAAADKELSKFLVQLDQGITRLGSGGNKLVLLQDIHLAGDATDATDALAASLMTELKSQKNMNNRILPALILALFVLPCSLRTRWPPSGGNNHDEGWFFYHEVPNRTLCMTTSLLRRAGQRA